MSNIYDNIRNFVRWSEMFIYWIEGMVETSNTGYDFGGELKATRLMEWPNFSWHYIQEPETSFYTGDYTFSIYAKATERKILKLRSSNLNVFEVETTFDLENGTVIAGTGDMIPDNDGWYRCIVSSTVINHSVWGMQIMICNDEGDEDYQGDGKSGLQIFGAMLNHGLDVESYFKTEGGPE